MFLQLLWFCHRLWPTQFTSILQWQFFSFSDHLYLLKERHFQELWSRSLFLVLSNVPCWICGSTGLNYREQFAYSKQLPVSEDAILWHFLPALLLDDFNIASKWLNSRGEQQLLWGGLVWPQGIGYIMMYMSAGQIGWFGAEYHVSQSDHAVNKAC